MALNQAIAKVIKAACLAGLLALTPVPAGAVDPNEMLADPVLEARAREISKGLRCLVCQNQSIDESDAELARDLRVLVRARLTGGDSNAQVVDYIVSRYGDFVLLRPPFRVSTLVLWLGPLFIVLLGLFAVIRYFRRPAPQEAPPPLLSPDERQRLDDILLEKDGS